MAGPAGLGCPERLGRGHGGDQAVRSRRPAAEGAAPRAQAVPPQPPATTPSPAWVVWKMSRQVLDFWGLGREKREQSGRGPPAVTRVGWASDSDPRRSRHDPAGRRLSPCACRRPGARVPSSPVWGAVAPSCPRGCRSEKHSESTQRAALGPGGLLGLPSGGCRAARQAFVCLTREIKLMRTKPPAPGLRVYFTGLPLLLPETGRGPQARWGRSAALGLPGPPGAARRGPRGPSAACSLAAEGRA